MKRFLAVFLVATLCVTSLMTTDATAATISRETKAKALFQMGLFQGYDTSGENFGLTDPVTREQALTLLIRMLGEETESKAWSGETPYVDVPTDNWAKPYIGDAKQKGYTKGVGDSQFGMGRNASMKEMTIFALRGLGYSDAVQTADFTWDTALSFAKNRGIVTSEEEIKPFTRGVAVDIIYATLFATVKGQNYNLITQLIKEGAVTQAQYDKGMMVINGTTETRKNNPPAEGKYTMKCMDNYLRINSDKLELRDTSPTQIFEIVDKDNYSYIKTDEGKYLTVADLTDGKQLSVSSKSFAWLIEKQSSNTYTIRPYDKTTFVVNASDQRSANGTKMILSTLSDAPKKCLITMTATETKAVKEVELNKSTADVAVKGTLQLTATISPSGATNKNVNWSSNDTAIAKVDSKGLVTGVKEGKATITVKTVDGSKTATCKVTVTTAVTEVVVTGVNLSSANVTVDSGKAVTLTATVTPSNATKKNVTWTSNNTNVATVNSNGVVTGVGAGTATITVKTENGKTAICTVNVNAPATDVAVTDVSLDQSKVEVKSGSSVTLRATVSPNNATNKNVTWSSNNKIVATVDGSGVVTGVSEGTAIITATTGNGKTAVCAVTVPAPAETSILPTDLSVNPTRLDVKVGARESIIPTITPGNVTNKTLLWSSSNSDIVSVDQNGNIEARKAGEATIQVTTHNNKSASCVVSVVADAVPEPK